MKYFTNLVAAALVAVGAFAQQNGITINSLVDVTVCQPSLITWTGGTPPYFLSILPAGQPSAAALVSFPTTSADSVTWNVNLAAGVSGFLNLRDSTGAVGQSATFTVLASSNATCVTQSLSVSAGPSATGSPSSPTTSGVVSSPNSPTTTKTPTTTGTGTGSSTTTHSGAISQFNIGAAAAAVIGAVALALAA